MKMPSFFLSSLFLSINRYIGKIGGVVIMAILGHYDAHVLAAFSLLFGAISVLFMGAISGQTSLQSEFARLKAQNLDSMGLLAGSILLFGSIAFAMSLAIWLIGPGYFIRGTNQIFQAARACFSVLALCIPLLALNNVLAMFMEGNGHAATISKVRIGQVVCGVFLVALIAIFLELSLLKVILAYTILDATALVVLVLYIFKKQLVISSRFQLRNIKQVLRPFVIGAPAAICQATTTYASFTLNSMSAGLGVGFATALSTITALTFLLQIPIIGISQQVGLDVAQQHSLKKPIWTSMKKGVISILSIVFLSILLLFIFRSSFSSMLTRHPMTSIIFMESIFSVMLHIVISIVLLFLLNLLRACGDYIIPQIMAVIFGAGAFIGYVYFIQPASFLAILNTYIAFNALSTVALLMRFLWLNKIRISALVH